MRLADGSAIRVDPQHLADAGCASVCALVAVRVLADGGVELAVWPERERAAIVIGGATQVVEVEQNLLASGRGNVAIGGEPADAIVNGRGRRRVVDVDELIGRELRIEGDAEQAALADGADGDRQERRRQQDAVLDDAKAAALLRHEQTPVGRELHGGRTGQAARDERFAESCRDRRGLHRRTDLEVDDQADERSKDQVNFVGSSTRLLSCHYVHSRASHDPRMPRNRAARRPGCKTNDLCRGQNGEERATSVARQSC